MEGLTLQTEREIQIEKLLSLALRYDYADNCKFFYLNLKFLFFNYKKRRFVDIIPILFPGIDYFRHFYLSSLYFLMKKII